MTNQFEPEQFLKLSDSLSLPLRHTNCKRFGLEPFALNTEDFSSGVRQGTNKIVGYNPEQNGKKIQHWYYCKLNRKDGEDDSVKKIKRDVTKKPGWFGDSTIFTGDCQYFAQRLDDVRKHFITHHYGISRDFIFKCTNCTYENKLITEVRKHMDLCPAIITWVEGGCVTSTINPMFVKNIDHWTGQRIGGASHNQKFEIGEPQKLLEEVRRLTEFLTVKNVVKVSSVESKSVNTQDDNMSEISDLLTDSETDEIDYGPSDSNVVQTEENSVFIFNVKEESSLAKIYGDKLYRNGLTPENKDYVMHSLAKEVLEQRAVMEWGRKLHFLRRKCEGRRVDLVFLCSLQEAFDKKLASYIVKCEDTETISSLMGHFSVGSLAAADLALISDLFHKFDENLSKLSEVEMVDLTVWQNFS